MGGKMALSNFGREHYSEQRPSIGITRKYHLDAMGLDLTVVPRTGTD